MVRLTRAAGVVVLLALSAGLAPGITQKDVDNAVQKGTAYLKARFKDGGGGAVGGHGIGPTALAGIALLECKTPASEPAIQAIAIAVREASYKETKTYQLALCLIFLDRLEDPNDVPLIQMLAVRLLAGQNAKGGWAYDCIDAVPAEDEKRLCAGLKINQLVGGGGNPGQPGQPEAGPKFVVGKLHPELAQYAAVLWAKRNLNRGDDNSNTQFAILAVWVARKHGVPVDPALDLIEKRFLATQGNLGGWAYSGGDANTGAGTPAMTCAGLLGLSTGVARREERRLKAEAAKKERDLAAKDPKDPKANDPFFNPPPRSDGERPARPKRPLDATDLAVQRGFVALGGHLRAGGQGGAGGAQDNLYFLWSMERVGVIYGATHFGGIDWFLAGAELLIRTQAGNGSWGGGYGPEVNTSFALLFLVRANLARDLSSRVTGDPTSTELRAGTGPSKSSDAGAPPLPGPTGANVPSTTPANPGNPLPVPTEDPSARLAAEVARKPAAEWSKVLERVRDAKGPEYTRTLVLVIHRVDGDRKKQARDALAERLTRMSAETLKGMTAGDDPELRRGAVLACAMKDDKAHVPDLIDRLTDDEDLVVRAAKAGLKSLTGQDFGPAAGATKTERKAAADTWRAWWAKQKK